MFKKIQLLVILTVLFSLPYLAIAANGFEADLTAGIMTVVEIFFGPDAKTYTTSPVQVLQFLIFPFIALWVVLYGILITLRIFRYQNWLNVLLSFLIAVIAGPTGGLVWSVRYVFMIMGYWGFGVFAVLFGAGVLLWGIGTGWSFHVRFTSQLGRAGRLQERLQELNELIERGRTTPGFDIRKVEKERQRIIDELGKIGKDMSHRAGK